MEAQTWVMANSKAQAVLVRIPTTHILFFCRISSTRYTTPVTRAKISMA